MRLLQRLCLGFCVALGLSACGSDSQPAEATWYKPSLKATWQWDLRDTGINTAYNVDLYDIDLFANSSQVIADLHTDGRKVICYFSAGSAENWRDDFSEFQHADRGKPLAGWEGETWLDIRSENVKKIMLARLKLAKNKGCDGVEPDNVDGFDNDSGHELTAQDQIDFNRFIANEAHKLGLSVALKNDLSQVGELVDVFDFAINEECFQWNECALLHPFIEAGKAVLTAEYDSDLTTIADANNARKNMCESANALQFSTLVLPLDLDDAFRFSCQELY